MANKIYVARETAVTWTDSSGDLVMTLTNLAAGAVRVGARKDWGAGSTPEWYEWRASVNFETAPVVGQTVNFYLATSDGVCADGEVGTGDAAGDVDHLKNMHFIGSVVVTSVADSHLMTASGICRIATRYVSPVVHNNTVDNLKNNPNQSEFTLTPIPVEVQ